MNVPSSLLPPVLLRALLAMTLAAGLTGMTTVASAPPASAVTVSAGVGVKAVHVAASKKGTPYRYGAVGPSRFDCSGLTMWTYGRLGKRLPRTAAAQYRATVHVSRSSRRPGDLVFFTSGSSIYHVGVYAGGGKVWHAPKTGDRVKLATIWTSAVRYGRVR